MHQEQFPVPAYPDVAFPGISFVDLTKRAPITSIPRNGMHGY